MKIIFIVFIISRIDVNCIFKCSVRMIYIEYITNEFIYSHPIAINQMTS